MLDFCLKINFPQCSTSVGSSVVTLRHKVPPDVSKFIRAVCSNLCSGISWYCTRRWFSPNFLWEWNHLPSVISFCVNFIFDFTHYSSRQVIIIRLNNENEEVMTLEISTCTCTQKLVAMKRSVYSVWGKWEFVWYANYLHISGQLGDVRERAPMRAPLPTDSVVNHCEKRCRTKIVVL